MWHNGGKLRASAYSAIWQQQQRMARKRWQLARQQQQQRRHQQRGSSYSAKSCGAGDVL